MSDLEERTVARVGDADLYEADVRLLDDGCWLNDNCIHLYIE